MWKKINKQTAFTGKSDLTISLCLSVCWELRDYWNWKSIHVCVVNGTRQRFSAQPLTVSEVSLLCLAYPSILCDVYWAHCYLFFIFLPWNTPDLMFTCYWRVFPTQGPTYYFPKLSGTSCSHPQQMIATFKLNSPFQLQYVLVRIQKMPLNPHTHQRGIFHWFLWGLEDFIWK